MTQQMTDKTPTRAADAPCFCDRMNIGAPGVSCGDCPTRDYPSKANTPIAPPLPEPLTGVRFPKAPVYSEAQMRAYALAARRAALEEAAQALDAQHEARKQHDNHAAVYARMVRELAVRNEG